ncbi:MAG: hypothetical protein U0Q12_18300 [Vicinamibacterales bacterium]
MDVLVAAALVTQLAGIRSVDAATPEAVQIALAESAGPPVAADATIYVLAKDGYRRVREGHNGFTCLITRERLDTMEPECYDAEGTATLVQARMFVERERATGVSEAAIADAVENGYRTGRFLAPRRPGIVYMLSDHNYVYDPDGGAVVHFPGHLMFYAPYATPKDVGTGPGAPYLVAPGTAHALMIVVPAKGHQ